MFILFLLLLLHAWNNCFVSTNRIHSFPIHNSMWQNGCYLHLHAKYTHIKCITPFSVIWVSNTMRAMLCCSRVTWNYIVCMFHYYLRQKVFFSSYVHRAPCTEHINREKEWMWSRFGIFLWLYISMTNLAYFFFAFTSSVLWTNKNTRNSM